MTNLDRAISHFTRWAVENGEQEATILADALEEIRDRLTKQDDRIDTLSVDALTEQPAEEQPATFEPWDCVKAKPGTWLYKVCLDSELVCGFLDSDGDRKVFNPDDDSDRGVFHCADDDLIFVRRLKPRVQSEPTFKVGDWVRDTRTDRRYEVRAIIQDSASLMDLHSHSHAQINIRHLRKIDPPAPRFRFGDRVRWSECPEAEGLITSDHGNGYYDVAFKDGTHPDPMDVIHGSKLTLDTSAD